MFQSSPSQINTFHQNGLLKIFLSFCQCKQCLNNPTERSFAPWPEVTEIQFILKSLHSFAPLKPVQSAYRLELVLTALLVLEIVTILQHIGFVLIFSPRGTFISIICQISLLEKIHERLLSSWFIQINLFGF